MEAILSAIADETTKTIFMLYGAVTKYERRAILLAICGLGSTATVKSNFFHRKNKYKMKVTPSLVTAQYLLVDKTLHEADVDKLYPPTLKELVHGDTHDVRYGQFTPKKLIFICDCELPGAHFTDDSALQARMKFIHIPELKL